MAAKEGPNGLSERLEAVWTSARDELEEAAMLTPATEALLDEFALALKGAEDARFAGVSIAEDKAAKRASQLADQLGLSPKARKKVRGGASGKQDDPFAALDELEQKRKARSA